MKLKFYVDAKLIGDAKANLACEQLRQVQPNVTFAVGPDKLNDLAPEEHRRTVTSLRVLVREQYGEKETRTTTREG